MQFFIFLREGALRKVRLNNTMLLLAVDCGRDSHPPRLSSLPPSLGRHLECVPSPPVIVVSPQTLNLSWDYDCTSSVASSKIRWRHFNNRLSPALVKNAFAGMSGRLVWRERTDKNLMGLWSAPCFLASDWLNPKKEKQKSELQLLGLFQSSVGSCTLKSTPFVLVLQLLEFYINVLFGWYIIVRMH